MSLLNPSARVRKFNPDQDFTAYVNLLNETSKHDGEGSSTTEQEQRDYAAMLTIDLNADRFVIDHPEQTDKLIAVCDVWQINQNPSADFMLLVHPEWRRQGVGSKLLSAAVNHANELNATAMDAYARPEQKGIQGFLEQHNFQPISNCTGMEIAATEPFPRANLPKNYTVRTYAELESSEEDKLELIVKAGNEFWGVLWGHKVTEDLELAREVMRKNVLGNHDEDAMFFLYDRDTYVGHDRVSFSETPEGVKQGYGGGPPGLHPDWHTPELAREFALVGLEWLYDQGCRQIAFMSWGESEETLQAFEKLGFTVNSFELGYQLTFADFS